VIPSCLAKGMRLPRRFAPRNDVSTAAIPAAGSPGSAVPTVGRSGSSCSLAGPDGSAPRPGQDKKRGRAGRKIHDPAGARPGAADISGTRGKSWLPVWREGCRAGDDGLSGAYQEVLMAAEAPAECFS